MQLSQRLGLTCSLLTLLCACGSSTAPKPAQAPGQATTPIQALPPAAELSPVAAPNGLIGVGRLARPGDLTKTLASWVSLPFEPSMIDALQPGLSQAVAFDAPVEFAVVLPDEGDMAQKVKPELVVSVGLSSTDKARALLEEHIGQKLSERGTGTYVTPDDAKLHCAIAPALGKAAARFVCGDTPRSLASLLPYATRGLPLEKLGTAELLVELRFEPLRKHFGAALRMGRTVAVPAILKEISLSDARFDRPMADVAHALGDELLDVFDDADRVAIDLNSSSKPEQLELKMTIAYKGRTSFVAQATAEAQRRMVTPNAQYFDLPADAAGAGYVAPADPKRLDKPRALFEGLVEGLLAHFEVGATLRRDTRAALDAWINIASPMVMAYGAVPSVAEKAKPTAADRMSLAMGWRIYGVEAPAAPFKESLKTLVKLTSDKAYRQGLDKLFAGKPSSDGKSTAKEGKATKAHASDWLKLKSKAVAGMPTGSEVLSAEFNPAATKALFEQAQRKSKKGQKGDVVELEAFKCLFAVVPDGNRSWFVFALDDKTLLDRAKMVLGSSKAPRLSTRTDLAEMRGQTASQAGFLSLMLAKGWLELALLERGKSAKEAETLLSSLPHHANTPIPYRAVVVGDDKHLAVEVSTTIPRAVFDDAAAAVPSLMMLMPD